MDSFFAAIWCPGDEEIDAVVCVDRKIQLAGHGIVRMFPTVNALPPAMMYQEPVPVENGVAVMHGNDLHARAIVTINGPAYTLDEGGDGETHVALCSARERAEQYLAFWKNQWRGKKFELQMS